jgi:hypothetical protein
VREADPVFEKNMTWSLADWLTLLSFQGGYGIDPQDAPKIYSPD